MARRIAALLPCLLALVGNASSAADFPTETRWQARVQLGSADLANAPGASRLLSANLLGDYYLSGSNSGGLRATGGMLLGPLSMTQSASGLALGSPGRFAIGQRGATLSGPGADALEPSTSLSYLGIGYTGRVHGSSLAFSADLGLMSGLSGGPRLGRSSAQGFEDAMRDLRFKPLLQLGLSYSY
jgi:hypothetical protein